MFHVDEFTHIEENKFLMIEFWIDCKNIGGFKLNKFSIKYSILSMEVRLKMALKIITIMYLEFNLNGVE